MSTVSSSNKEGMMRRWSQALVLMSMVGMTGIAAAHEGHEHGGQGWSMPPEVKAVKEKYYGLKQQLHEEYQQKLQALEAQEHQEFEAAMKTAHEKQAAEMEAKHDEHMKHREEKYQEHKAQMEQRWKEHHDKTQ